jgi:hypothetical protein
MGTQTSCDAKGEHADCRESCSRPSETPEASSTQRSLRRCEVFTAIHACRSSSPSSPQKQIDAQWLSSVRRAVRTKRTNMTSISFPLCPVPVTGSLGSLTSLCKSMFLPDLIRRHNDPADDFHLDFHKMVCIAFKTDRGTPVCNTTVCNF